MRETKTGHDTAHTSRTATGSRYEDWTESRLAGVAWHHFREDLLVDAWRFRPLPPIGRERLRRWPRLARAGVRWLPHAVVIVFAVILALAEAAAADWHQPPLIAGFYAVSQTLPVGMVLLRPVGAWWLSLGTTALACLTYPGPGTIGLMAVMILVTLRSRPRVAVEMWVVSTVVVGLAVSAGNPNDFVVVPMVSFITACFLGTAVAVRGWWLARGQVAEQETLVADVRGRHTLLEERARIARELHDVVAHHMSVIAIQAEAAPYRVEDPPGELTRSFALIRESAVAALSELRRVLGVLRFEGAEAFDAPDAPQPDLSRLDDLVQGVRDVGLPVEVARTGAQRPLPQGVELSAYRIVQEALSNALRHAPGSQVRVEVSYVLTGVGLRIVNTAPTAEAQPSPGMGHGVTGMRERATMLGGELAAGPTEDGGYEVAAFLPAGPADHPDRPDGGGGTGGTGGTRGGAVSLGKAPEETA
ncbi:MULTISPECIES: sensor histidine kinase [unclassified Streptomyces]|uniref:sensor histidine kinase n=1 Tax=unclassified Streptomyces TaxID=2593676 RepID=UPI000BF6C3AC|nr:histidine kinase [Streptomyces sp. Ru87]PGH49567.1 two-component sensor histidine kinase [Streptomyces sp. Ru87]